MKKEDKLYTHEEYRSARVAHLLNCEQEMEFYYQNKPITLEAANEIVEQYKKRKSRIGWE